MEKDKSQDLIGIGSLLPPSDMKSGSVLDGSKENAKSEQSGPTTLPANGPGTTAESGPFGGHGITAGSSHFSHDISRMLDNPPKNLGHRRARSEIFPLPDDISFDRDLGVVGGFDGPSYSDETEEDLFSVCFDIDKFNSLCATSDSQVGESTSSAVQTSKTAATPPATTLPESHVSSSSDRPKVKHQHSVSMDGSTTYKPEMLNSGPEQTSSIDSKKSMSDSKVAELALVDPKRAKRIWANRQSAARSKERKMRYIAELERKVQTLQTEATSLSAQRTLLQRDTRGLSAENSELKLRVQTMEQQIHLQDALNVALREEIQHLKVLTGQNLPNGGPMMNFRPAFGANQQFPPNNQPMHTLLTAQQFQQLQIQTRKQQQQHHLQPQLLRQFQQQQHPSPQHPGQQLQQNTDLKNRSSLST